MAVTPVRSYPPAFLRNPDPALPAYIAAGALFAGLAARGFLVPLQAHELGADRFTVGLLFTLSTLSAAILSLPAGFLADRFGRRSMVMLSAVLGGGSQVAIAFSGSVPLFAFWQVVGGLGAGAAQAAIFATVADTAPRDRVGRAMGWATLGMQVGFLAGPAVAGVLLTVVDLRGDLAVTSALYAIGLVVALGFPSERVHPERGIDVIGPLRELAVGRGFWAVVLGLFAATLLWGTVQAYLPLFGKEVLRLPGAAIGYLLALQAISNGLARIPGGRLVDRAPQKGRIVAAGILVYAVVVFLLPHTAGFWAPAVLLVGGVPFLATAFVAITVAFSQLSPPDRRGVAMGVYGTTLFVGLAVGPLAFGPVMSSSGYAAGFGLCAVSAVALSLVMLGARVADRRLRPAVALPPSAPGA